MDKHTEVKAQDTTAKKILLEDLSKEELITKCKGLLTIAQKAKQAKSELQNEIADIKSQLTICESQKQAKEENVKTLQELVDSLTEQKLSFITEIDSTQSKIRLLSNKCQEYEEEILRQKAELQQKDQYIANLSQKLSDVDSEIISLKRQNKRLLEENEQLITQLTELEAKTEEFNNIGLQQREQLKILEEKVQQDEPSHLAEIEKLKKKIAELETSLNSVTRSNNDTQLQEYAIKITELTNLYESEKTKKDKANIKLRSYKDKILKCANCINQLKNSRFILTKTVQEYSENIPKWQNEIIKASKVLEDQMKELNTENSDLKLKLQQKNKELLDVTSSQSNCNDLHDQISKLTENTETLNLQIKSLKEEILESNKCNIMLNEEIAFLKSKESELLNNQFKESGSLKEIILELQTQLDVEKANCTKFEETISNLKEEKSKLNCLLQSKKDNDDAQDRTNLLIKALESEKATLVKEKQNAKDSLMELENRNTILNNKIIQMEEEIETMKSHITTIEKENKDMKYSYNLQKDEAANNVRSETALLKEKYEKLKQDYDNIQDLNTLLQEEVETLKLSLEQPKYDADNLSDLNVSLQADIVKLETKLAAYKQENASLLLEVKESRCKTKEFDSLALEYEDMKSKLMGYKTENAELLNEMKEINEVLKERGEALSKLQKAVSEMEKLIETLEKDRDTVKDERDSLLKQIDNLQGDLKNAEEKSCKNTEAIKTVAIEKEMALKLLEEKDAVIMGLREELDKQRQQGCSNVELPNDDMSTSTISKAEEHSRMRDLDETFEDKYTKLRMFALKLKKKLNETTSQLQTSEQEQVKLKKLLAESNLDIKQKTNGSDGLNNNEEETNKSNVSDLEAKIKNLTTELEKSAKATTKLAELEASIHEKNQQLTAEMEAHKVTKAQLDKALRDVKKKNVLSLEMEDYERSMKELTTKMEENKKKIIQMESTIDTQEGTITAMKTQIKLLEEQIKTEEAQNRHLKEELQQSIEDGKDKENLVNAKKEIITKLMHELEDEKRKNEEAELEMTSVLSEKERIITNFGEERLEMNSKMKKLEFKCAELNEKLRITSIELADLKTEYTSYKVRAQAVLRQNQTVDHSQEEQLKEEAAALKAQVDMLTQKLSAAQQQSSELTVELEAGRKRVAEANAETARAQQRTARLQVDLTRLSHQLDLERSQQKIQISTLTQCYKSQITELETKLQKETENFNKQLALLQENAKAGKSNDDAHQEKYTLPVIPREEGSDSEMDINVSLIPREEGEGSEAAPSPPLSKSHLTGGGRRSPVPLERLLEEGVPENDFLDTSSLSLTSEQEIADLRRKVQAQQERVKHVTVLLAESERECARLGQLSELLKGELRRVRASAPNAHNTEYMKNVTLKFLTLPPGDERSRLVPVLQKILTLSSDETYKIQAIAKGQDPNPGKGWGSYLPWPGGK